MRSLSIAILTLAATVSAAAAEPTRGLTKQETAGAVRIESLSIPGPGEFFAAIAKVERPNWSQLTPGRANLGATSRPAIALNLGTRVADGYLAVEAQDSQRVKNIGRDIMELARKLNASESALARGKSINDFAENNDWNALREELEAAQNEVKITLHEQKDDDLISLITVGAWVRGVQAGSEIVVRQYSPDAAALLRQPAIADLLLASTETLPDRITSDETLVVVKDALARIRWLTEAGEEADLGRVEAIHAAATDAVENIHGGTTPAGGGVP